MTPQQHKQHLLALADALKYQLQIDANGELIGVSRQAVDEAVVELRNIAARLTPGVSDAIVVEAMNTYMESCNAITAPHDLRAKRAALEAVFPLVDDGAAKEPTDAMIEAALHARVPGGAEVRDWLPMQSDAKTSEPIAYVIMNYALVAAMAAPPKDTV